MPVPDLSMPLSILGHGKESGVKQGIQSDWRLVTQTMVVKIGIALIYDSYLWIYISGRTEKISGALFEKQCARGRKILSGQMHPCWRLVILNVYLIFQTYHEEQGAAATY